MYELMVIKEKLNKWKVTIAIVATALIVTVATMDGIWCARNLKATRFSKEIVKQAEEIEQAEQIRIQKQEELYAKLPTWEKLEKISTIYKAQEEKRVFLTFDDGPSKAITIPILDLLKQEEIKATFFVLGKNAERNPEIIKRAYEEGHFIANHGYTHSYSTIYQSVDSILEEYNRTEEIIREAIGNQEYTSHLFRYPGGSTGGKYKQIKKESKDVLSQNEIYYLDWNALTKDAEGARTSESQLNNLENTVGEKSSVVLLMHDAADKQVTYETLPAIIAFFKERGYQFKNIYDLMQK